MARPGTRRYGVDLLANMRLYDETITSIKDGKKKLDSITVRTLESYTGYSKDVKNAISGGDYDAVTKLITKEKRKHKKGGKIWKEWDKAQKLLQIKSVHGPHSLIDSQYQFIEKTLKKSGKLVEEIEEFWDIISPKK